jgi:fermentation-respiration switch protein FrsA (DUF1100 family)
MTIQRFGARVNIDRPFYMNRATVMLHWIWKLFALATMTLGILSVYVYLMQSRMLYYPNLPGRALTATPADIGLEYQDVRLATEDGVELHGWFIPGSEPRRTLLFFHGNAGNISHRLDSIALFHRLGPSVFIFDYRGYGQSTGSPTEQGTYLDAEAAWNYLTRTRALGTGDIIVFGRSLGGAIATRLASRHTPAMLMLESTFTSVPAMAQRFYPFLPVRLLSRFQYDSLALVKNLACPLLIAHSRDDEIIPYEEGRMLFDAAPEPRQFLDMRGGHNDGFIVSGPAYEAGLRTFIDAHAQTATKP